MATSSPDHSPQDRIESRLSQARERRFVGRAPTLARFWQALESPKPPFAVLYLYGPGGVGKTSLLDAFARMAARQGVPVIRLDGRAIEPSPAGFLVALRRAMHMSEDGDVIVELDRRARSVLFIDTYEQLGALDAWLRERFLPTLPAQVLVVIAGRGYPHPGWRTDDGWGELVQVVSVRNLTPEEARDYLLLREVPEDIHDEALEFTHGHPLALSLIADLINERGQLARIDAPDVVRVLLERFMEGVPDALHRRALQVCAHSRVTTEPLLAEALGLDDAREIFDWLRELSFIDQGQGGLFRHDLARDVLDSDLRWRNPEGYRSLHLRIRDSIVRRIQVAHSHERQQATFDLMYMHRHNPIMKPRLEWDTLGSAWAEVAVPTDHDEIVRIVTQHEGTASGEISRYWLGRQPGAFQVFRSGGEGIIGFLATVRLVDLTPDDLAADPALAGIQAFMEHYGPERPGDLSIIHRFSMGSDTYQAPSQAWDLVIMASTFHWLTTPGLAWSFLTLGHPEPWAHIMDYINLQRCPDADFMIGGRWYRIFGHDWRVQPPIAWMDMMAERELDPTMMTMDVVPVPAPPLIVLSEPQFADAIRQALRDLQRPDALAGNPLLQSRLVRDANIKEEPASVLRVVIEEAIRTLKGHPKDERLYRALHRTYLSPAGTQELAAEALGLPFSTYRSHLAAGVQRVIDFLWQRELYGPTRS